MSQYDDALRLLKKTVKSSLLIGIDRSVIICYQRMVTNKIFPSSNSLIFKF